MKWRMESTSGLVPKQSPPYNKKKYWSSHAKYRRHTDPNGRYDQNEIKRKKGLNYFKQHFPIFRFEIQTFLRPSLYVEFNSDEFNSN